MLSLIGSLLSFLPSLFTTVNGITTAISNERIQEINAKTDQERIDSQERVSVLQARRDVMIAESGDKINRLIRASIGGEVSFLLGKILVWDKALGFWTQGHTDNLDPNLWWVVSSVIGFYFLTEGGIKIARIIKA